MGDLKIATIKIQREFITAQLTRKIGYFCDISRLKIMALLASGQGAAGPIRVGRSEAWIASPPVLVACVSSDGMEKLSITYCHAGGCS